MIVYSDGLARLMGTVYVCGLFCMTVAASPAAAQGLKMPEAPKLEAPKIEEPKIEEPKIEAPEIPGAEEPEKKPAPKKNAGNTRKVIGHHKQWAILPRTGLLRVTGAPEEAGIDHIALGIDLQFDIQQKFYLTIGSNVLYITQGSYGLSYIERTDSLYEFSAGHFTSLTGIGAGINTSFFDKNKIWSRFGIKVGYLHPFYVPIWLTGDLEKEFRKTRTSYFVVSASPLLGIGLPIRQPVTRSSYFPAPVEEGAEPESSSGIRFMLGAQLSVAFIFAPRG